MKKTLLWLDDYRDPFDEKVDWMVFSPIGRDVHVEWVKSYRDFVEYIKRNGLPDGICFDHDLGLPAQLMHRSKGTSKRESRRLARETEKTGYDCAKWLCNYCDTVKKPLPTYAVQSANVVGKQNIISYLENYKKMRV